MKRWLALVLLAAVASPAVAQESPQMQLDFVRKLRAKGYHDLCNEYIELLLKTEPQFAGQLSLEQARSLVAMAREKSLDQRSGLFNQARDKFQEFVKKNEGKPEAAQARLEMAKLIAYHGQAILSKALREHEDPKSQHDAARKAEELFLQAGQALEAVQKQLEGKEQTQAMFDRAINYLDQARTYLDLEKTKVRLARGEILATARKAFLALAADENTDIGLLANAWLVKCNYMLEDPDLAGKHLRKVLGAKEKAPYTAQRLARYFFIEGIPGDVTVKTNKLKLILDEGSKWLKDYPGALKSWEGQGVQFELGNAILAQAQATYKDLKTPAAAPLLNQAAKLFSAVADLDGDLAEEAKRRSVYLAVVKLEKTKLEDIHDFENSLLKAHYEAYKLRETVRLLDDAKDDAERKKLAPLKKQHYREAVRALRQTLNLVDGSTPLAKVDEVRSLQMQLFWAEDDLARAAIAGEYLGKMQRPPTKNAPKGIGVAFLAYDALGGREDSDANRQRVRELAEFVLSPESQKFWAKEPISAVARHHLAMLCHKEKDFKRAIDHLEKLPLDFAGYVYSQGQIAFIAVGAAGDKNNELSDDERRQLRDVARKAIKRMPAALPVDADPTTATMYFLAQMELAKFLYKEAADDLSVGKLAEAAGKYKEMGRFVTQHQDAFKKSTIKFEDKTRSDLATLMEVLHKYTKLGLADVEYRLGNYDKVLSFDLVGPIVQKLRDAAKSKKEGKVHIKDFVVSGEILGLAVRTYVQKADLENAEQVFHLLDRLAPEDEGGLTTDASPNLMVPLVREIETHVKTAKKGDAERYKSVIDNYAKFMDAIAETLLKKRTHAEDYIFLANAYATLERPQRAAELYAKVPVPKQIKDVDEELVQRAQAKKPGFTEEEGTKLRGKLVDEETKKNPEAAKLEAELKKAEAVKQDEAVAEARTNLAQLKTKVAGDLVRERQEYWYLQIRYGESLRESKDYKKAYGVLERLLNHPLAEYHILASMEKLRVIEDNGTFGPAIKGWGELIARLRDKAGVDDSIKKLYFDCYYEHARCWYKYSQSPKTPNDKKEAAANNAARYILSLETAKTRDGWDRVGERFRDLLEAEPYLKTAYDKLKKAQAAQAPAGK